MRTKFFFLIFSILVFGLSNGFAQEMTQTISGGILNGKAVNLFKPPYPAAARTVNAEGAVNVQVTIDENGNVISASAVSGHPLLRAAAVEAARASKFSPTTLSGQPVKVTGVIVYNFIGGGSANKPVSMTISWFNVGQNLASLERMTTLKSITPSVLNSKIPEDWTAEREQIKRLEELKKAEMQMAPNDLSQERVIGDEMTTDANKNQVRSTTIAVTSSSDRKASSEAAAISQSLVSSIRGRLSAREIDLWYFNLGIEVSKAISNVRSPSAEKRTGSVKSYRDYISNIPAGLPEGISADLEKIAVIAEKGIFTDKEAVELSEVLMRLSMVSQN